MIDSIRENRWKVERKLMEADRLV